MGNICRSPMAERLLVLAARQRLAKVDAAADLDGPAAQRQRGHRRLARGRGDEPARGPQILLRGGSVDGFAARKLRTAHLAEADLIVTGHRRPARLRSRAAARCGRPDVRAGPPEPAPARRRPGRAAAGRHRAVGVHGSRRGPRRRADRVRGDTPALPEDDLDDPWGAGDQTSRGSPTRSTRRCTLLVDMLLPAARQRAE
jgi:protein-tyrosine phosphatase